MALPLQVGRQIGLRVSMDVMYNFKSPGKILNYLSRGLSPNVNPGIVTQTGHDCEHVAV